MLSFIYRIANNFEGLHGQRPNVLYLNRFHFENLRQDFARPEDIEGIMNLIGMSIMITEDAINPGLARIERQPPSLVRGAERAVFV
ncbi:MAG: hypothetical protein IT488_14015 [Gammaproteobacteria bacterium]|nr:hypothetical protein [Gammaproteobacteria bacterium]